MPRPPMSLVPLPNYKGKAGFLTHGIPRNHFFDKPWLRYPIYSRLPEYWRKQHETKPPQINIVPMKGTKRPQHEGLWTKDEQGNPIPVKNFPINVLYPEEVKNGLYGGEGIVRGWRHARGLKSKPVTPRNWMPSTSVESFWSEVLERWIETTVTPRTLRLIDEAYGFDHYILKTPEYELCSKLGSNLKREMLFRLLDKDTVMYVNDPEKRQKVYDRYKKYAMKREDAEWVGLSLFEAMKKQWDIEKARGLHDSKPLLDVYTDELKRKFVADEDLSKTGVGIDSGAPIFQPQPR